MRERIVSLSGALLALVVATLLLVPPRTTPEGPVSLPTSGDPGPHGMAGFDAWLRDAGVPVHSLRERYSSLFRDPAWPSSGNLMVTSAPHRMTTRHLERKSLTEWVSAGNTVLVLYGLADSPPWLPPVRPVTSRAEDDAFIRELGFRPHRTRRDESGQDEDGARDEPSLSEVVFDGAQPRIPQWFSPAGPHPVLEGVRRVFAERLAGRPDSWHLDGEQGMRSCVVILHEEESRDPVFWHCRVGAGDLFVSVYADLFSNERITSEDNATLAANLVNYSVTESGFVIFDDMHLGLTGLYDPAAFFGDARLHRTLWFLAGLWVIYLVGHASPLGRRARGQAVAGAAEFVRTTGNLFARRMHTAAAARRILVHFFNEVRMAYGMTLNGLPVWDTLSRNARVNPGLLEELRRMNNRAKADRGVNLIRLVNLISRIRKGLI